MHTWITNMMNGSAVKRFHTIPTINEETVGQHSFGVAMVVLAITEQKASTTLLRAALFHDMAEGITGDTPFTSKAAFPMVKYALAAVEEDWEKQNGFHIELDERDRNTLKWADMIQLLLYCKMQRDLGNRNMDRVFTNGITFLATLKPEGKSTEILNWLIENYGRN